MFAYLAAYPQAQCQANKVSTSAYLIHEVTVGGTFQNVRLSGKDMPRVAFVRVVVLSVRAFICPHRIPFANPCLFPCSRVNLRSCHQVRNMAYVLERIEGKAKSYYASMPFHTVVTQSATGASSPAPGIPRTYSRALSCFHNHYGIC